MRAPSRPLPNVRALPERPSLAVVVRDGDPRAAIAVAVLPAGAFDAAGPRVPVALAAVTEARLAAAGLTDVTVAATWDGYRVRALLPAGASAGAGAGVERAVKALREALVTPIAKRPLGSNELLAASHKLDALARRPLHERGLEELARCTLAPVLRDGDAPPPPSVMPDRSFRVVTLKPGRSR